MIRSRTALTRTQTKADCLMNCCEANTKPVRSGAMLRKSKNLKFLQTKTLSSLLKAWARCWPCCSSTMPSRRVSVSNDAIASTCTLDVVWYTAIASSQSHIAMNRVRIADALAFRVRIPGSVLSVPRRARAEWTDCCGRGEGVRARHGRRVVYGCAALGR